MKNIVGAIDGSFIKVASACVPPQQKVRHVNRKGFMSLILQAVVDSNRQFRDIDIRTPGSQGDWNAFRASPLCLLHSKGRNCLPPNKMLLADSGYFTHPILLTPYSRQQKYTRTQTNFNFLHSRGRVAVEDSFGILKERFARLHESNSLMLPANMIPKVVLVACILHNLLRRESDFMTQWRNSSPAVARSR